MVRQNSRPVEAVEGRNTEERRNGFVRIIKKVSTTKLKRWMVEWGGRRKKQKGLTPNDHQWKVEWEGQRQSMRGERRTVGASKRVR